MSPNPSELDSDFASRIRKGKSNGSVPSLNGLLLTLSPTVVPSLAPKELDAVWDRS